MLTATQYCYSLTLKTTLEMMSLQDKTLSYQKLLSFPSKLFSLNIQSDFRKFSYSITTCDSLSLYGFSEAGLAFLWSTLCCFSAYLEFYKVSFSLLLKRLLANRLSLVHSFEYISYTAYKSVHIVSNKSVFHFLIKAVLSKLVTSLNCIRFLSHFPQKIWKAV